MSSMFPTYHISSGNSIVKQWIPANFPLHNPFPVKITTVVSPSNFWIQLKGQQFAEELKKLEAQMELFYHHLHKGEYYYQNKDHMHFERCAAIDFHGSIRRVMILCVEFVGNHAVAVVFHCDYGLVTRIESQYLMKLNPSFSYLPQQAISATLANIEPKDRVLPWKPEVCSMFACLVRDKIIEAELVGALIQKYKMHLQINDVTSPLDIININDSLVSLGCAIVGNTINSEV